MTDLNSYQVVSHLKRILPIETWEWVIPALRTDDLVWKAILTPQQSFQGSSLEEIIQSTNDCTPANLSLKALSYPNSVEELRTLPLIAVHPSFDNRVDNAALLTVQSLAEAGLSALNLRNKRMSTGSWNDWTSLLAQTSPTVLTCLFGMIPDQIDFLCALLPYDSVESCSWLARSKEYDLLIHILTSNPQPLASKVELIRVLLEALTPDQRTAIILRLFAKNPALANYFSGELTDSATINHSVSDKRNSIHEPKNGLSVLELHTDFQQNAFAAQLQNQIQDLAITQAYHLTKLAIISARQSLFKETLTYLEKAFQLMPHSSIIASSYWIALWNEKPVDYNEKYTNILNHFEGKNDALIELLIELFKGISSPSNERLSKIAAAAIKELQEISAQLNDESPQKDIYLFLLAQLTSLLIQVNLYPEAEKCTSILLIHQPNNIPLYIISAYLNHRSAQHQIGNDDLEYCECLVHPNQAFLWFLYQSRVANKKFGEALTALEKLNQSNEFPQWGYEFASTALHANSKGLSQNVCKNLLEQSPDDGIALALYAEASDEISYEQREKKFEQTIQLNPSHPYPWLAYARFLRTFNQPTKSLDILKGAAQTLPQSAEIQLALGIFYADDDQPSLALTHLRAAEQILNKNVPAPLVFSPTSLFNHINEIPDFTTQIGIRYSSDYGSTDITYDQLMAILIEYLGHTLRQLGHLEEAQDLLMTQVTQYPDNPSIAYQLAKTYLQKGDYQAAEDLLKEKILPFVSRADALVDYARCLWFKQELDSDSLAIESLNKAIQLKSDYFAAYPLLADFLLRSGDAQAALRVYDQIFQFPQAHDASSVEKLKIGLSQAALQAGEYELALATLLECNPANISVLKLIAQTYAKTSLMNEAIKYANLALEKDPKDVENLSWYAVFLSQLPKTAGEDLQARQAMTIKALETALEKDPRRDDLLLLLGDTYYDLGQAVKALQIYQDFVLNRLTNQDGEIEPYKVEHLAQTLINLGDFDDAITCWKYRLSQIQKSPQQNPSEAAAVLATLASIFRHQNDYLQMQSCYQQALEYVPDDPQYILSYLEAVLLSTKTINALAHQPDKLNNLQEILERALQAHPEVPDLALALALIYRILGKQSEAISLLQYLSRKLIPANLELENETKSDWIAEVQLQLARIYQVNLQPSLTKEALQEATSQIANPEPQTIGPIFKLWCDWIEHTLSSGDNSLITYQKLCEIAPQDLHLQAIAIKIKLYNGDKTSANNLFETAIQSIGRPIANNPSSAFSAAVNWLLAAFEQITTLYSFAEIALQNRDWNVALELLNKIIDASPNEALAHYSRLFSIISRAEYQNVCKGVDLLLHSPGESALNETSHTLLHSSLKWLKTKLAAADIIPKPILSRIEELELRGMCVFEPDSISLDSFTTQNPTLGLTAAKLNWLASQSADLDLVQASYPYQNNAFIQFTLSNCIQSNSPLKAIHILESLLQNDGEDQSDQSLSQDTWLTSPQQLKILTAALYAKLVFEQYIRLSDRFGEKLGLALNSIQTALDYYPDEPHWNMIHAKILLANPVQRINLIQASQALEKAITNEPRRLESQLMLAKLQIELDQINQAIDTLLTAHQLFPDNIDLKLLLSQAYFSAHNLSTAVQFADLAINQEPTNYPALCWRTELALAMKDATLAQEFISRAQEILQSDAKINQLRAKLAMLQGNYEEALHIYEESFPIDRQFENELIERVTLTRQTKGTEKAYSLLQDIIEKIPNSANLQRLYASYLAEIGNHDEAISTAQTALRICHQPSSGYGFRDHALCHQILGKLFSESGHLDQAVHHLIEAAQLNPNDAESFYLLGEVYTARSDYNRSLNNYLQAIQIDPNSAKAYFKAGLLYKDAKDYPNAEQMFRQAAKIEPNNLTFQRQLGAVVALNLLHYRKTPEKK